MWHELLHVLFDFYHLDAFHVFSIDSLFIVRFCKLIRSAIKNKPRVRVYAQGGLDNLVKTP